MGKITGDKACFDKMCQQIEDSLGNYSLGTAIKLLEGLLEYSSLVQYEAELSEIRDTYNWMIKYMIKGVTDPDRTKIYEQLLRRVYIIFDDVRKQFYAHVSSSPYYEQVRSVVLDVMEALRLCASNRGVVYNLEEVAFRDLTRNVFNAFWSATLLEEKISDVVVDYLETAEDNDPFSPLLISALSLGLLEVFDEQKLLLLMRVYRSRRCSDVVRVRALVGLVFSIIKYESRLALYPTILNALQMLGDDWPEMLHILQLQLLMTQETKNIAHKMNQEIFPEMMKNSALLRSRTTGINLSIENIERNPLWEKDESFRKIEKKLQIISELQQKGVDVYWATFSALKQHYPFYKIAANWFLSFSFMHPVVRDLKFKSNFMERFLHTPFLCDSDKYSFCLMIREIPESQRDLVEQQLPDHVEDIPEWNALKMEVIVRHYLQDLYRFYTLFIPARQLYNPFEHNLLLADNKWLLPFLEEEDNLLETAEFALSQQNYAIASHYYELLAQRGDVSLSVWQKWGYSLQLLGQYHEAISCYEKSVLLDPNDWSREHLAQCYLYLKDFSRAVALYHELNTQENVQLKNLFLESNFLMHEGRFKEALKVLYRALYLAVSDNDRDQARRAIAWCQFLVGDLEQSVASYHKISELSANDYLNLAHVLWAQGTEHKALGYYVRSIKLGKEEEIDSTFFNEDQKYLKQYGITLEAMMMMVDAINYMLAQSKK